MRLLTTPYIGCRGHSFLSLNKELLDSYAACATSQEVVAVQQQWLEDLRDSHAQAQAAAAKGEGPLRVEMTCHAPGAAVGSISMPQPGLPLPRVRPFLVLTVGRCWAAKGRGAGGLSFTGS